MMFPKKLAAPAEDSELNDDDGPVSSTAPVLPAEPAGVSVAAWFPAVADLLDKGVPGTLQKAGAGKDPVDGCLSFVGEDTLRFAPTKSSKTRTKIKMSGILDVEVEQQTTGGREETSCRVLLKGSGSFIFVSKDAAGDLSRDDVTKFVALFVKDKIDPLHPMKTKLGELKKRNHLARQVNLASTFAELLQPLGLIEEYCVAFNEAGILFEDLGVVTREDLAELVGITDRRHQIKVMAQIKRCFPGHPPCCCCEVGREAESGAKSSDSGASAAVEAVASVVVGALLG